ncbi:MAG: hypothetical protein ACXAAO_15480 [Candidatus Thorarchaeota archaeon]|jgi:hypothetical protein
MNRKEANEKAKKKRGFPVSGTCYEIEWTDQKGKRNHQFKSVEFSTTIELPASILRFKKIRMGHREKRYNILEDLLKHLLYVEHAMNKRYYIRALLKINEIETDYIIMPTESIGEDGTEWEGPPVTEIRPLIDKYRSKISKDIHVFLQGSGSNIGLDEITQLNNFVIWLSISRQITIISETLEDEIIALLDGLLKNETRVFMVEPPYPKSFDQLFFELTKREVKQHFKQLSDFRKQLEKDYKGKRTPSGEPSRTIKQLKTAWLREKRVRIAELREFLNNWTEPSFENPVYSFVVFRDPEKLKSSIAYSLGLKTKDFKIGVSSVGQHFGLLWSVSSRASRD